MMISASLNIAMRGRGQQLRSAPLGMVAATVLLALLPLTHPSEYLLSFLFIAFMYASLASSWNIVGGFAGYLSFGHAAFFGIGGYATGLALLHSGWSPFITAIPAALLAGLFAALVGYPVLRLRGPYFALVTLILTMVVRLVVMNLSWTKAAQGFWLPFPPFDNWTSRAVFYEVMLAILVLTLLVVRWVQYSKLGIGLIMIRNDEEAAQTFGVDATFLKVTAFVLSAALAGLVGGIFAYYRTYVHPNTMFDAYISVTTVLMALFGGRHIWLGPALGAITLSVLSELLTLSIGTEIARVVFGLLLVAVVVTMPDGILGFTSRSARAHDGSWLKFLRREKWKS